MTKYLTTTEAAHRLNVSPQRVRDLIHAKRLSARKVGRNWLVYELSLERVRHRKPGRPRNDGTSDRDVVLESARSERERESSPPTAFRRSLYSDAPAALRFLKDLERLHLRDWQGIVETGKFSPEGAAFFARRLHRVAREMHDVADRILRAVKRT